MWIPLLTLVIAYLIGSISGSLVLGRLRGVDIRQHGSGNAGGTNAFRTQGWKFAFGVVLMDIGKGVLAVYVARWMSSGINMEWLAYAALLAAVLGHVWPVFHGFRGGKGAATLVGGLLVVWPMSLPPLILVWLLCLGLTGYVGLASILAAATLCLCAYWQQVDLMTWAFAVLAAWLMVFTHRSNLQRLMEGKEHRFEKAMLWRKFLPSSKR